MEIEYKSNTLKRICEDANYAQKKFGDKMAQAVHMRIDQIRAADSVEMLIQFNIGRCHLLTGNRKNQYAMTLIQPYRLIFEKREAGIVVRIIEIVDYH